MKLLIVGFSESIHVVRWIDQLKDYDCEICLFPSVDNGAVNKELKNVKVFHTFYGNISYRNKNIKRRGIPVLSHLVGIVFRMVLKKICPDYYQRYLKHVIKHFKPDIIHSMEMQNACYLVNEVKKKWEGKFPKWIATNWGSDIYLFSRFKEDRLKIEETLSSCDFYSCECERDVFLAKKFGFRKEVLPTFPNTGGFDLAKLRSIREKVQPSKRKAIMLKGYQGWAGRAQVALHALDRCGELLNGYELIIYSMQPDSGVDEAAELLARKYAMKLTIVPLDTSHEKILKYQATARISIGLSISDGISTMVLESMVMGSFPIQSNTSAADEWIEDGITGMIVPPEDPEVIEKMIQRALTDDMLVDNAAIKNWKVAEEMLDCRILKEKIRNFYQKVLG